MKSLRRLIGTVLKELSVNNVPLSKIVIQKAVYYIKERTLPMSIKFVPYTYGPYSSSLACELDKMVFWDMLEESNNEYNIIDDSIDVLDEDGIARVAEGVKEFISKLDSNYSFDNIELLGTVLYCIQTLSVAGDSPTLSNVVEEFKGWKGDKYSVQKIGEMYSRLQ